MRKISLPATIIACLLLIITVLLSLFCGAVWYKYRSSELAKLRHELELEVSKLQISLGGALWNHDIGQVNAVLHGSMRDLRLSGIAVSTDAIRIVVGRDENGQVVDNMPIEQFDTEIRLDGPITKDGKVLGSVELYATSKQLSEHLLTLLKLSLASIVLLDLLLTVTLYHMLNRMMISPLMTLKEFIVSTRSGDVDLSVLKKQKFQGELEVLRSSIVEIIRELDSRYKSLQESEAGFKTLLRTIPDLVWLKDVQGKYLTCNKSFERFVGKRINEIIGRTDYELFDKVQADWFRNHDKLAMEKGEPLTNEEWVIFSGEVEQTLLDTTKTPMFAEKGELVGVLGVAHDITARKKNEEERILMQTELSQMQKFEAIGRLAGGISHDFNNMLSVILGHTELILEQLPEKSPLREDLREILDASKRSTDLTRQLLAFAREQAHSPELVDINKLISNMIRMLTRLIGEDVQIDWLPGKELWPVKIDPSQLDQILVNLCVNARDAIDGNGRITLATENVTFTDDMKVLPTGAATGDFVKITVADSGCGMDESVREQAFEPFFTTKDFASGTGLGLSTVYGIVKQNNGLIELNSVPDNGTTFDIYLPKCLEDEILSERVLPQSATEKHHGTILVVEDEPSMLSLITRSLTRKNYTVFAVSNPLEALAVAKENSEVIDLILTDIIMPEMNGVELVMKLKDVLPGVGHIYMSGYTHDVLDKLHIDESQESFIQKPFQVKELHQLISKVLS